MGKQKEGSLQERIQTLLKKRGAYCFKNHGDMTTEPGRPDIVCCYNGLFIAIEAKEEYNTPSPQQGIHCRNIWKAGGIACVVWSIKEVEELLDLIDMRVYTKGISNVLDNSNLDDGTRW